MDKALSDPCGQAFDSPADRETKPWVRSGQVGGVQATVKLGLLTSKVKSLVVV